MTAILPKELKLTLFIAQKAHTVYSWELMIVTCIIVGTTIVLLEIVIWIVFRRKIEGICFPNESDHSHFGFFSMTRLRVVAILHTIALLLILIISTFYLW